VRLTCDERVVRKSRISRSIGDNECFVTLYRVRTKRVFAWGRRDLQPDLGLEPLTSAVNQRHQRDWRRANHARQLDNVVERSFARCIEDPILAQQRKALLFVQW
jgi:hypothetical protein